MIHYVISLDDLQNLERDLGIAKDKSKYILRAAINQSAKDVEKRMVKDAAKRYALNKGGQAAYKKINKIKKATVGDLAAIITASGSPLEMLDYKVNNRTYYPGGRGAPKQIKGRVLKQSRYKPLAAAPGYKAFIVKYKSGHLAVAERVPGTRMRGSSKEAVRSLYSISLSKSEEVVFKKNIDADVYDILAKNIQEQIARFLG